MTATRKAAPHDTRPDGSPYRVNGLAVTRAAFDAHLRDQQAIRAGIRADRLAREQAERARLAAPLATVTDVYGNDFQLTHDHAENSLRIAERLAANDRRRAEEAAVAAGLAEIAANKGVSN